MDLESFLQSNNNLYECVLYQAAQKITLPDSESEREAIARRGFDHKVRKLKEHKDELGVSALDYLIFEQMSKISDKPANEFRDIALNLRHLEANPAMVENQSFPSLHKQAKTIVLEELEVKMNDPRAQIAYLVDLFVEKRKKKMERDYEFALPTLGPERSVSYSACLLELSLLQTEDIINESLFKTILLEAFQGQTLQLIHIKSLRYTYPKDSGLRMLEDTSSLESVGINGEKRIYPSEDIIFHRLNLIISLFEFYGVKINSTLIIADHDLGFLFPDKNDLIDEDTKQQSTISAQKYINYLKDNYPQFGQVSSLTEFLTENNLLIKFEGIYSSIISQAKKGSIDLVNEKVFEAHVDHQFQHYQEMFGEKYTRALARFSATNRVADLISLSAIFEFFPTPPIVVIDGRGFETKLIGAQNPNSRSIFLTKLKNPTQVVQ